MKPDCDIDYLLRNYTYDRVKGAIYYTHSGKEAGYLDNKSKIRKIMILGKMYTGNRVAWALHHQEWPTTSIYYANGDTTDISLSNLSEINNTGFVISMSREDITQDLLIELIDYNPETGEIVRLPLSPKYFHCDKYADKWNRRHAWSSFESLSSNGYKSMQIFNVRLYSHQIAWIYTYGQYDTSIFVIDHINHDGLDNSIGNLRCISKASNIQHQVKAPTSNTTSGLLGVHWSKQNKKWMSQIRVQGKRVHVGTFEDKYEAYEAYLNAKRFYHPETTL